MADYLIGRLLKRGTPMASGSCTYNSRTGELRSKSDSWFQHDPLCKEAADAIAARDAEIARLRAEVADLLPMLDADGMIISTLTAEIARLTDGIRSALEGRYERVDPKEAEHVPVCGHGMPTGSIRCIDCLRAHLSALIAPRPAPEERPWP